MTNAQLIEILNRYGPEMPIKVADVDGQFDATAFDIQIISAPAEVKGFALCISAHNSSSARQVLPQVRCPRCHWVHSAIPRHHAEQYVSDAIAEDAKRGIQPTATMNGYFYCIRCGEESGSFEPTRPDDAPVGCTLQVVVIGRRQSRPLWILEIVSGLVHT